MKYIVLVMAGVFLALNAQAQTLTGEAPPPSNLTPTPPAQHAEKPADNSNPLEITADTALEWQRNEKIFIARGNALAKQADTSIAADTLTARYEEKKSGGMDISEVEAQGHVVIRSKDTEAMGENAKYSLDNGYAFISGRNLRMTSPDQIVTAQDKFEYWVNEGKFSAIGKAKVIRGQHTLEADSISATMKDNDKSQRVLDTLEAKGNVIITSPAERVTGSHGLYHANTNKAEMSGGIRITRGPNVLTGEKAEVDLTTNTSRIFGNTNTGNRVKGIFYPGSN